jgi:predicted NBD/HSP70 family sugar kinase
MFILFDIGGTHMRFAASQDGLVFGAPLIENTPQDFTVAITLISSLIKKITKGYKVQGACGGIAGVFDQKTGILIRSPHLPQWEGKSLRHELSKIVFCDVFIENDTALAALGESVAGASHNSSISAFITFSTGIGGARIVDGKIDRKHWGFEVGHQVIDFQSMKTFEEILYSPARSIDEKEKYIAIGLNNTILHWSPEVLVLGGPRILLGNINIKNVIEHVSKNMKIFPDLPDIKKTTLNGLGGLHGALEYLKQVRRL